MPYTRLDDQLWSHRKILAAGNEAAGAFVRMISYCGAQLSDGVVPDAVARFIAGDELVLRALVDAELIAESEGGWQIHDYLDWQESRETVLRRRDLTNARNERYRRKAPSDASPNASRDASRDAPLGSGVERSGEDRVGEGVGNGASGFSEWLAHFQRLTGLEPSPQTEADFRDRRTEGYSLDALKLATAGIANSDWHRDKGYVRPDFILRADKLGDNIERGRQLRESFEDNGFGTDVRTAKTREGLGIA